MNALTFSVGTFDVVVEPSHLLLIAFFALTTLQGGNVVGALSIAGVVFGSILWHELGHAAVARRLRVPHGPIVLHGIGGFVSHAPTTPAKQLLISLAGPAAMLLIGIPVALALDADMIPRNPGLQQLAMDLAWINVGWAILNLLPMSPLDGGQALHAGLALFIKARHAALAAGGVGLVCGLGIAVVGAMSTQLFIMLIGGFCAYRSWQMMPDVGRS
jgi:Zn-dependent protease